MSPQLSFPSGKGDYILQYYTKLRNNSDLSKIDNFSNTLYLRSAITIKAHEKNILLSTKIHP